MPDSFRSELSTSGRLDSDDDDEAAEAKLRNAGLQQNKTEEANRSEKVSNNSIFKGQKSLAPWGGAGMGAFHQSQNENKKTTLLWVTCMEFRAFLNYWGQ
jgi:hypothetical protein